MLISLFCIKSFLSIGIANGKEFDNFELLCIKKLISNSTRVVKFNFWVNFIVEHISLLSNWKNDSVLYWKLHGILFRGVFLHYSISVMFPFIKIAIVFSLFLSGLLSRLIQAMTRFRIELVPGHLNNAWYRTRGKSETLSIYTGKIHEYTRVSRARTIFHGRGYRSVAVLSKKSLRCDKSIAKLMTERCKGGRETREWRQRERGWKGAHRRRDRSRGHWLRENFRARGTPCELRSRCRFKRTRSSTFDMSFDISNVLKII